MEDGGANFVLLTMNLITEFDEFGQVAIGSHPPLRFSSSGHGRSVAADRFGLALLINHGKEAAGR